MPLPKDWRAFIESLNSNGVERLLAVAVALAHHGFPRYTGDIDVFIHNTDQNARRVELAIGSFGFEGLGLKAADFAGPYQVVQLGLPPHRIDILTSLTGVAFGDAWSDRVTVDLEGMTEDS